VDLGLPSLVGGYSVGRAPLRPVVMDLPVAPGRHARACGLLGLDFLSRCDVELRLRPAGPLAVFYPPRTADAADAVARAGGDVSPAEVELKGLVRLQGRRIAPVGLFAVTVDMSSSSTGENTKTRAFWTLPPLALIHTEQTDATRWRPVLVGGRKAEAQTSTLRPARAIQLFARLYAVRPHITPTATGACQPSFRPSPDAPCALCFSFSPSPFFFGPSSLVRYLQILSLDQLFGVLLFWSLSFSPPSFLLWSGGVFCTHAW
jgi:hypothetical protein